MEERTALLTKVAAGEERGREGGREGGEERGRGGERKGGEERGREGGRGGERKGGRKGGRGGERKGGREGRREGGRERERSHIIATVIIKIEKGFIQEQKGLVSELVKNTLNYLVTSAVDTCMPALQDQERVFNASIC